MLQLEAEVVPGFCGSGLVVYNSVVWVRLIELGLVPAYHSHSSFCRQGFRPQGHALLLKVWFVKSPP